MTTETTKTLEEVMAELEEAKAETVRVDAKNKALLAEKSNWKTKNQEAQDEADEAARLAAEASGNIEELKKAHAKELEKERAVAQAALGQVKTYKIDNVIKDAIAQGNVPPHYVRAVTAILHSEAEWDAKNMTAKAKSGDDLAEFAKSWLTSDEGQHYTSARNNDGGSVQGGAKAAKLDPSTMSASDKATLYLTNKSEYDRLFPSS